MICMFWGLAYVLCPVGTAHALPVMDLGFGSWQLSPKQLYKDQTKLKKGKWGWERENTSKEQGETRQSDSVTNETNIS